MGIPLIQFLEPVGARRAATRRVQPLCARLIHSRCAARGESQPPDVLRKRGATWEMKCRWKARKAFLLERAGAEQHADTTGILGTFEIERGVANVPGLG